jgi:Zn-finger protein
LSKSSILQDDKVCYFCGCSSGLQYHHIYKSANRKISDRNGFTVWLCYQCHQGTNGVHGKYGHEKDIELKQACQATYELTHTREEFRKLIGRSYL